MDITLQRLHHTRWGVDGQLSINGSHIADTTEHPTAHLAPGTYPVTMEHLPLKRGNGPMLNTDGTICVGEHYCSGCVLKTREIFGRLYHRIRKTIERGKTVNLIIKSVIVIAIASMTSCSTLHRVQVVEHSVHDTLYLSQIQYDSIYIDRYQTSSVINDTVYLESIRYEYKYKLLHDTIRQSHIDSIPVIRTVEVTKTVKQVPSIYKWALAICIILIVIILAITTIRVISAIRVRV